MTDSSRPNLEQIIDLIKNPDIWFVGRQDGAGLEQLRTFLDAPDYVLETLPTLPRSQFWINGPDHGSWNLIETAVSPTAPFFEVSTWQFLGNPYPTEADLARINSLRESRFPFSVGSLRSSLSELGITDSLQEAFDAPTTDPIPDDSTSKWPIYTSHEAGEPTPRAIAQLAAIVTAVVGIVVGVNIIHRLISRSRGSRTS